MLTMDVPPEAPPAAQVVLIAQAPQMAAPVNERVMGVCQVIPYRFPTEPDGSYWAESGGGLDPQSADVYFHRYESRTDVLRPPLDAVEVLQQPKHGVVKQGASVGGELGYNYIPDLNYAGSDKVVFRVKTSAGPVVIHYYLAVSDKGVEGRIAERLCDKASNHPKSKSGWKISSAFTVPSLSVVRIGD